MSFQRTHAKKVIQGFQDELKLNPVTDEMPLVVVPTIQPIIPFLRYCNVVKRATASNGTATIYTTPGDRDFFLNSVTFSTDDASADTFISVVVDGVTTRLIESVGSTVAFNYTQSFPIPIKIDRNTPIIVSAVGVGVDTSSTITGYEPENG